MKRFLLIPSFAFLAMSVLTSCQKEEKTALELTQELTSELQKVTDFRTAEAAAPRVEAINKRMQNAGARPFALNETALTRSAVDSEGSEGAAYGEALAQLAAEIGRIQASAPVGSGDGEIDRDKLILAVGAANGAGAQASAADRKKAGTTYIQDSTGTHDTPGNFPEYYGSDALRNALSYRVTPDSIPMTKMDDDSDVPAIPAAVAVPDEEEAPAEEAAEEPAEEDAPAEESAEEEPAEEEPAVEDEPAATEEEPAEEATEEEPSGEEEVSEEEDSSLDDSAEGEESLMEGGDDMSLDLDL
ncbi:MAG: hypothetical protein Q4F35_07420 [Akkermansia sp.]|nr:hypothetical protein [Akkermansia sp.]